MLNVQLCKAMGGMEIPSGVLAEQPINCGVLVDAYLVNVAKVGSRPAARVFFDPLRSTSSDDHHVIAHWLFNAEDVHDRS